MRRRFACPSCALSLLPRVFRYLHFLPPLHAAQLTRCCSARRSPNSSAWPTARTTTPGSTGQRMAALHPSFTARVEALISMHRVADMISGIGTCRDSMVENIGLPSQDCGSIDCFDGICGQAAPESRDSFECSVWHGPRHFSEACVSSAVEHHAMAIAPSN